MYPFKFYPTWLVCGNCHTIQYRSFYKRARVGSRHLIEDCTYCKRDSLALVVRFSGAVE